MADVIEMPASEFIEETCCECGFTCKVPAAFKAARRQDRKKFWCPRCGTPQSYVDSEVVMLRHRVAELEALVQKLSTPHELTLRRKFWMLMGHPVWGK